MDRRSQKETFQQAVSSQDPYQLAALFQLPQIDAHQPPRRSVRTDPLESSLVDANGTDWSAVLTNWLDALEAVDAADAVVCYDKQSALHTSFNQVFASSTGNILVPALHAVCRSTHSVARAADQQAHNAHHAKLEQAVSLLQESFSRTYNDRNELKDDSVSNENSKKLGVLGIVNQLFAIYFRLNTLRLCKNLVRPVEAKNLQKFGSIGQKVTYQYYVGRLYLFEDQYRAADEALEFALNHCNKDAVANKKRILQYLIPVKLYRGRLPSAALMEKYGLYEYVPLVDGIRKGDLRKFNDTLIQFQHQFIRQGTYLLLEKCKTVCYRNLFKRIHLVLDKHQISLSYVAHAFQWLGMPIDLDEVECILANLIYRGYVRGYLSHTKRMLVLSKRDPFPVSSVIATS